jgi:hypothetical protein
MPQRESEENFAHQLLPEVARSTGEDVESVRRVVAGFARELHRHAREYEGFNGDFIGEDLVWQIDDEAYFHLLGFLDYFAERYAWDRDSSSEYLLRLNSRESWEKFSRQMENWNLPKRKD